jgi:hypothetical protein
VVEEGSPHDSLDRGQSKGEVALGLRNRQVVGTLHIPEGPAPQEGLCCNPLGMVAAALPTLVPGAPHSFHHTRCLGALQNTIKAHHLPLTKAK